MMLYLNMLKKRV